MLFSDSLPQLWMSYGALSLVVLVTGYLGVRFLPLLPKLLLVGIVAGALWMVAPFTLPLLEPGQTYAGLAPAIVVLAVGVLQHDGGQIGGALPLLLAGSAIGAILAVGVWWLLGRRRHAEGDDDDRHGGQSTRADDETSSARREPVV
ncbi:hypothetical protein [Salinicola avicenniae]|uniref:hypothetical protein n=1 Tax=Salinicola avicenniae TaxID=2916836 RepID=UPI0020744431|nr:MULTISPECIES: hypothetical protein [unclassified Salinicola]